MVFDNKALRITLSMVFTLVVSEIRAQNEGVQAVTISVDLDEEVGEMEPVWSFFGYDEPNYTYMKDGKKLIAEIGEFSPVPVYYRAHNLLTTGDGTARFKWGSTNAYTEDENGNPVYDWTIIDKIFDTYIENGAKPLVEIGFMPKVLSTQPEPYEHFWKPGDPYGDIHTGWRFPPNDYDKWAELIFQWVKHSVDRYGQEEVESWYWQLWNEPDAPYWGGTIDEFLKLYDYTADAVKRALPTAQMGGANDTGPGSARGARFLYAFLQHCLTGTNYATGEIGSPLDAILFHAKGAPSLIEDDIVQMDMGRHLRNFDEGFKIVASYPKFKDLPIIIGESDPEGCAACGETTNPSNAYRNGTMYSSYTAASFARKYELADKYGVNFKGAVTWSFEFEDQPWFHGFRDLATNGVDKPVLNVFRMFAMMEGKRVQVVSDQMYGLDSVVNTSIRNWEDIGALASISKAANTAAVMIWNYHDVDAKGEFASINLNVNGVPSEKVTLTHFRIDDETSNSYQVWKEMGSPQNPSQAQVAELEKSGKLETMGEPRSITIDEGEFNTEFFLPRQGVSLLKIDW
ncbi:xylan 1,4-beta-xylosidase [Algoriphagus sp. 4150]|uniref:GH39 family glycosyl hydrolase n=1 Tax=Algoriphagus sp. 4150 TaxID=2817756 RepID=UPI00285CD7D2|nr:xylan 1,4-beta-xylosidase [Algoriphagus sp. 4150]